MTTAAILLAAGASTRLGEPKQTVRIGGETLLDRALRLARGAELDPLIVVLGSQAKHIAETCDLRPAWVVVNAAWGEGMGSSIRVGTELAVSFPAVSGAILMTCDMPAVTATHLRAIVADEVVASRYADRQGVPAYFPRGAFAQLLNLSGDIGARELLRSARAVALPYGELDIDTPRDLERARSLFEPDSRMS